jgi:hypothetical protein
VVITLEVWDTTGSFKLDGGFISYYRNSDACVSFYTKNSDNNKTDMMLRNFKLLNPNAIVIAVF